MGFRILHSISSVNPAGGGPIEGLKQLAAINIEHGHSVEVVSRLRSTTTPPGSCHGCAHIGTNTTW
jgi:hypothetical protein